ncbi:sensor histidine kinase [Acanthopleuribacter pedis]|uniref:histidine kinase n=1 Tax=Acanthopleuribacter pedis TaxID=442870 RepID=A0A8J7QGT1_9BACT|nr:ATP-binding protein [Acanthopleuribacter pedis]MBO1322065.1 hypothetical protein [Acanthopleuribacter pedis]
MSAESFQGLDDWWLAIDAIIDGLSSLNQAGGPETYGEAIVSLFGEFSVFREVILGCRETLGDQLHIHGERSGERWHVRQQVWHEAADNEPGPLPFQAKAYKNYGSLKGVYQNQTSDGAQWYRFMHPNEVGQGSCTPGSWVLDLRCPFPLPLSKASTLLRLWQLALKQERDGGDTEDAATLLRQKNRDMRTEINRNREQLMRQEKLASIGTLTAGISHELKNPLNFVNNFSGICLELVEEMTDAIRENRERLPAEVLEDIDDILITLRNDVSIISKHGKRATSIIHSMLMLARNAPSKPVATDINALTEEYVSFAYHGLQAKHKAMSLTIHKKFDERLGYIVVVPQTLSRVILNLLNNACYAVLKKRQEVGGDFNPEIWVSTEDNGATVDIVVRDNGFGIPAELLENIFKPFFTTKPPGEGTGLGLAICRDIVLDHGGDIRVVSEPDRFTEFRIQLPKKLPRGRKKRSH